MKAIIGLGNPGPEYSLTRHNLGFIILDWLRDEFGLKDFKEEKALNALMTKDKKILLAKPLTYMNDSGKAVLKIKKINKLKNEDTLIIHDDMDFSAGQFKLSFNRSSAGHRGVQSIIDSIKGTDFYRLRLGIGRPKSPNKEYVLSELGKDLDTVKKKKKEIFEAVDIFIKQSAGHTVEKKKPR